MSILIILSSIVYLSAHCLLNFNFKKKILLSQDVDFSIKARKQFYHFRLSLAVIYGIILLYSLFSGSVAINGIIAVIIMSITEMQSRSLPVHFKYPCEVKEPFILYLRGFSEDDYEMSWRDLQKRSQYDIFSEGAFFFIASQYMRCYSVGMTKELSSPIGTERVYLTDDDWKEGVNDLMKRASLIIINIHDSDSCAWEIVQSKSIISKTIIICDNYNRLLGMRTRLSRIGHYGLPFFTKNHTYANYNDTERNYQIFNYENNNKSYKRMIKTIMKQKCGINRFPAITNRFVHLFSIGLGILGGILVIYYSILKDSSTAIAIFLCIIMVLCIIFWCWIFPVANYPWRSQRLHNGKTNSNSLS